MKRITVLFIALFCFYGCATTTYLTNDDYKPKDREKKNFTFLPVHINNLYVQNSSDVTEVFTENEEPPNKIIRDKMYRRVISQLNKTSVDEDFDYSHYEKYKTEGNHFIYNNSIDDLGDFHFIIPKIDFLSTVGIQADVVIYLSNVVYKEGTLKTAGIVDNANYSPLLNSKDISGIIGTIKFIIWDYEENKMVKFGEYEIGTINESFVEVNPWIYNFDKMIHKIVGNTPYWKKYNKVKFGGSSLFSE